MQASARRTAAVAAATTLALALSPSAALAAGTKRVTQGNGTLLANGAAITLPTTFTCPPGYLAYVSAQVIQAIDDEFAGGYDTSTKECTGKKQRITFFIQAIPAGDNTRPFEPGTASSRVILDAVDPEAVDPYFEEGPEDESASSLLGLPPMAGSAPAQYATVDDPMSTEPSQYPPTIHAEARGPITLKEKARS